VGPVWGAVRILVLHAWRQKRGRTAAGARQLRGGGREPCAPARGRHLRRIIPGQTGRAVCCLGRWAGRAPLGLLPPGWGRDRPSLRGVRFSSGELRNCCGGTAGRDGLGACYYSSLGKCPAATGACVRAFAPGAAGVRRTKNSTRAGAEGRGGRAAVPAPLPGLRCCARRLWSPTGGWQDGVIGGGLLTAASGPHPLVAWAISRARGLLTLRLCLWRGRRNAASRSGRIRLRSSRPKDRSCDPPLAPLRDVGCGSTHIAAGPDSCLPLLAVMGPPVRIGAHRVVSAVTSGILSKHMALPLLGRPATFSADGPRPPAPRSW